MDMIRCDGHVAAAEYFDLSSGGAGGFCAHLAAGDGAVAPASAEQGRLCDAWGKGQACRESTGGGVGGFGGGLACTFWGCGWTGGQCPQAAGKCAFDLQFYCERGG